MKMPLESDWEKFSALLPVVRDRYLAATNARVLGKLTASGKTETERFWEAIEDMQDEAKVLHRCLDDYSRSKMWLALITMRGAGMLQRQDLADFSQGLQDSVFADPFAIMANQSSEPTR